MTFMQIFNIFSNHTSSSTMITCPATTNSFSQEQLAPSWPEIERRTNSDRRQQERRNINFQPYIDTRKNHGRRRSFGRRATDQIPALPFWCLRMHSRSANKFFDAIQTLNLNISFLNITKNHFLTNPRSSWQRIGRLAYRCAEILVRKSTILVLLNSFCAVFLLSGQSIGRMEPAQNSLNFAHV